MQTAVSVSAGALHRAPALVRAMHWRRVGEILAGSLASSGTSGAIVTPSGIRHSPRTSASRSRTVEPFSHIPRSGDGRIEDPSIEGLWSIAVQTMIWETRDDHRDPVGHIAPADGPPPARRGHGVDGPSSRCGGGTTDTLRASGRGVGSISARDRDISYPRVRAPAHPVDTATDANVTLARTSGRGGVTWWTRYA